MKLTVVAVGKMKKGPERELAGRYFDRLAKAGAALGLQAGPVVELTESRASTADARKAEEAEAILKALPPGSVLCMLDERGEDRTSQEFASALAKLRDEGSRELCVVIGGPDGLDPSLLTRSALTLAFGRMTWPHQIVRILIAEQLYRAVTILSGHPYHRS